MVVLGGLLGGFTTYSSFALLSWELVQAQRVGGMFAQLAGHVIGGLMAVAIGLWLGELIAPAASD